jgi:methylamine---glutamate N-methyltransferase subunit C
MNRKGVSGRVTLIITGGLRTHTDFAKALALGADGVAISNSAMQAIGCVGARICNTNLCPAGIATQNPELRKKLDVDHAAGRLANFFQASVALMSVMARACGHDHLSQFQKRDLASWKKDLAELAGIEWSGFIESRQID